jgi:hypothetical protein
MAASALARGRRARTDGVAPANLRVLEESLAPAEAEREILDYSFWSTKCAEMAREYAQADPFPHAVLTGLLRESVAKQLAADVALANGDGWTHYKHVNEYKEVIHHDFTVHPYRPTWRRRIISTEYKPRPGDGAARRALIYADKLLLRGYDFARRKLGFSNQVGSELLRVLSGSRRRHRRK